MLEGKKIFNVIGIFLTSCILVVGISFAYGSITNKLPINGYASMNTAKWSVHFQNLSNANLKGKATEINKPVLQNNSTSISDFDVMFENVNDGVTYTFEVVNDGSLDAKVSSIVIPKPTCMEIGETSFKDSNSGSLSSSVGGAKN